MKSREISRSKIGPFSLACTDPYIGIGWEYQSVPNMAIYGGWPFMTPLGDVVKVKITPKWILGFCWLSCDEDVYQLTISVSLILCEEWT